MFDACGKVKCLFYGTILLINFIKIVNVVFILFPRLYTNSLTSYSIMNGKMAAQVLSSTVSNVFSNYASPVAAETAKFCSIMDAFFESMNIRDKNSRKFDLKPSLIPFSLIDDPRFSWLRSMLLQFFDDWLHSIEHREGRFSRNAKIKMFISLNI